MYLSTAPLYKWRTAMENLEKLFWVAYKHYGMSCFSSVTLDKFSVIFHDESIDEGGYETEDGEWIEFYVGREISFSKTGDNVSVRVTDTAKTNERESRILWKRGFTEEIIIEDEDTVKVVKERKEWA